MSKTATGKLCQMLIIIRHSVLFQMMTAIELYHPADCLFLSIYPGLIIGKYTKKTPYQGDTEESFVINYGLSVYTNHTETNVLVAF